MLKGGLPFVVDIVGGANWDLQNGSNTISWKIQFPLANTVSVVLQVYFC